MLRYAEANAVRAKRVRHARDWPFGSLAARLAGGEEARWMARWPVDRPEPWEAEVDAAQDRQMLDTLRACVARGRPFGSEAWVERTVKRLGLEHTVRDPWRPKRKPAEATLRPREGRP